MFFSESLEERKEERTSRDLQRLIEEEEKGFALLEVQGSCEWCGSPTSGDDFEFVCNRCR